MASENDYELRVSASLPTRPADDWRIHLVSRADGADPHLVLEHWDTAASCEIATVRLHSACLTGDVFRSVRCDCGPQLDAAMALLASAPWGLLVYAVEHEGRGIGLEAKLKAYLLQEEGYDTFTANRLLGYADDLRRYDGAVAALRLLGVSRLDLLSQNPHKATALANGGLVVRSTRPLLTAIHPASRAYQLTKAQRYVPAMQRLIGTVVGDVHQTA